MARALPDQHGLNAARAAQAAAAPAMVILFGSRATGRHRQHSDVDLLVVTNDSNPRPAAMAAYAGASRYLKANPPPVDAEVIGMTRTQFDRCRRANQHIAGQAARYGVIMNGAPLPQPPPRNDAYPDHWPETRRRIENAETWNRTLADLTASDHWHQELIGFAAQQAVENALKGWLSACNDHRTWGHRLSPLWNDLRSMEDWSQPGLTELYRAVRELFRMTEYTDPRHPGETADWLTDYAARYRYAGTPHRMTAATRRELQQKVDAVVTAVVNRIHAISGTAETDVYPAGLKPWNDPPPP